MNLPWPDGSVTEVGTNGERRTRYFMDGQEVPEWRYYWPERPPSEKRARPNPFYRDPFRRDT